MMMKLKHLLLLTGIALLAACSTPTPPAPPAPTPAPAPPMAGADADAHGCKASAGYQWSALRNECIRLFESGIRLNPKAAGLDQTVSAFVVFKSDTDNATAELFLPTSKQSVMLAKTAGTWKADTLTLTQAKGMYVLKGKSGVTLYEGSTAH